MIWYCWVATAQEGIKLSDEWITGKQSIGFINNRWVETDVTNKIIEVKKEDVDVIMAELEVTEDEATSAAQDNENNGDASIKGQQLIAAALWRLVTQSIWYLNTRQTK